MSELPAAHARGRSRAAALVVPAVLALAVCGCAVYANLSFAVRNPADYRCFPPFEPNVNANANGHLGSEYFNIARALAAGEGFANPFGSATGPTAWMPPVLPALLAGLLRACSGSRDAVMVVVIVLQVATLIGTGFLVVALAREATGQVVAALVFLAGLLCHFHLCFQITHDSWLVMLALDLLVAGLCWGRPLRRRLTAAAWGGFGGLCALVNPILALTWGGSTLLLGIRQRAWSPLAVAVLTAGLVLTPWTARNYLVFGRLIPVKSNLAYELYQSECLQPDGLIERTTFEHHPGHPGREGREYRDLGEIGYVERKWQQFGAAVLTDPVDFLDRAAVRFLAATLWYEPFDRQAETRRPWLLRLSRVTHPLPFLGLLVLVCSAAWRLLTRAQSAVIGVYLLYLLPYTAVSYYERYGVPLLGVKVLLVLWAGGRLLSCLPGRARAGSPLLSHPAPGHPAGPARRRKMPGAVESRYARAAKKRGAPRQLSAVRPYWGQGEPSRGPMAEIPPTRASLLVRLRDPRDAAAWREFVDRYAPLVYGYARKQGLQDADAADLCQDVLAAVAGAVGRLEYDPARGAFRNWLFTAVRRKLTDWRRARRTRPEGANGDAAGRLLEQWPAPEDEEAAWEAEWEWRLFAWACEEVRPAVTNTTWQAFWRTAVEDQPGKRVAADLGLSVAAVYRARSRVLARLKELVRAAQEP